MSSSDTQSSSVFVSPLYVKPIASGAVAILLDRYVLKNPDTQNCLYFGGAVAFGTAFAQVFSGLDLGILPDSQIYSGKLVSQRLIEIILAGGSAYGVNRFVLNNDFQPSQMTAKLGVIVASEIIGEYISDYMSASPLSYLQ